jgi:hypothetical protein
MHRLLQRRDDTHEEEPNMRSCRSMCTWQDRHLTSKLAQLSCCNAVSWMANSPTSQNELGEQDTFYWAGSVAQVIERLPSKHKALSMNPSAAKTKTKTIKRILLIDCCSLSSVGTRKC